MITYENSPHPEISKFVDKLASSYRMVSAHIIFKDKGRYGLYGMAYSFTGRVEIYTYAHFGNLGEMKATIAHEIGHCYHAQIETADYYDRTEYGQELYAEDFANRFLGREYSFYNAKSYKGGARNQVYKEKFPHWIWKMVYNGCIYYEKRFTARIIEKDGGCVWRIDYPNGSCHYSNKVVQFQTAKKNVVRRLRKAGVKI